MAHFEIEIKSLLGEKAAADALKARLEELFPEAHCIKKEAQLNHYFVVGDVTKLAERVAALFSEEQQDHLRTILLTGSHHSVRTRKTNDALLFVVKASVGNDGSSSNGISRMEFEEPVQNLSLDELDAILLQAGFTFQAKWSREREEYVCGDMHVCFDKNAGYGYVAEFERVLSNEATIETAKQELLAVMERLGVSELPQDRLERMFAFYNAHWQEYYGTEKIFTLE